MALCHALSEIFNVEKYCDLEIPIIQESVKAIENAIIRRIWYGFLLVFYSNFIIRHAVFEMFNKYTVTL